MAELPAKPGQASGRDFLDGNACYGAVQIARLTSHFLARELFEGNYNEPSNVLVYMIFLTGNEYIFGAAPLLQYYIFQLS